MVKRIFRGIALCLAVLLTAFPGGRTACAGQEGSGGSVILHGPQIPPDGLAYDEWQQLTYSTETSYDVTRPWRLLPIEKQDEFDERGYIRESPVHGTVTITDVKAEPVGGEMKLRSGGFVRITAALEYKATYQYSFKSQMINMDDLSETMRELYSLYPRLKYDDICTGYRFTEDQCIPFDRYTGISLVNSYSEEEIHIKQGEALDSGFVESRIVWKGRTFSIMAREDQMNAGFASPWNFEEDGDWVTCSHEAIVITEYTFIVPADYDGLALAFYRHYPKEEETEEESADLYVDILTNEAGDPRDAGEMIFIRVSDLLDTAEAAPQEE